MKLKLASNLGLAFLAVAAAALSASAQTYAIVEGQGIAGLVVGTATRTSVTKKFGNPAKVETIGSHSYRMWYPKLGLAFSYCKNDPKGVIVLMSAEAPNNTKSAKGAQIGKTTWGGVRRLYAEADEGTSSEYDEYLDPDMNSTIDLESFGVIYEFTEMPKKAADGANVKIGLLRKITIYKAEESPNCVK